MSGTYLLDANALIALSIFEHEHHERAARWSVNVQEIAVCPISEGALYRFLVRSGASHGDARRLLTALYNPQRVVFWPDAISYRDADLDHVVGHRQVTDAYLASLAATNNASLATFDEALAAVRPDVVTLIP